MIRTPLYLFRGLAYLFRHRELWPHALLAFAVNVVVFSVAVAALVYCFGDLTALAPDWAGLAGEIVLGVLIAAAGLVLLLFAYTIVGNAIAGPFLDAMCQRMLAGLGESPPPPRPLLASILIPPFRQLKKLVIFGALQLAALLLWLIPAIGALAHAIAAATLLFYFLGYEYLEYPLDARGLGVGQRIRYTRRHLGRTLAFGASVALISLVPFLGYLCLPVSVAAATLLVHETGTEDRR
jgi:CysZ protein